MARNKKYDFRPDKVNNDIIGKLLLTKQHAAGNEHHSDTGGSQRKCLPRHSGSARRRHIAHLLMHTLQHAFIHHKVL